MAAARGGMWCALVAGAVAGAFGSVARGQVVGNGCGYEVIETLPDGPTCGFGPYVANILDINDAGTVCGYLTAGFCPNLAFMQEPGGPLVILPAPLGSLGSLANAMNEQGVVVGNFRGSDDQLKPCKWVNGVCIPLPMLRNANFGDATGVNASNLIVGYCTNTTSGPEHACAWQANQVTDIHPGREWQISVAVDVNDAGQIAGTVYTGATIERAFRRTLLGDVVILPVIDGGSTSTARAIDANGDVVGAGAILPQGSPNNMSRSFLWRDGVMLDLGVIPGSTSMRADDVTDDGRIVGRSTPGGRMFIWDDGVLQQVLVNGSATSALQSAINNLGVIGDKGRRIAPLETSVADIDRNCAVNTDDLIRLLVDWGQSESPADLNHDSTVNAVDLQILLEEWG